MSQIVCNSGPLIALGILGKLELLRLLFGDVLVPEAVRDEIVHGGAKLAGLENFQRAHWIRVLPPKGHDPLLEALLDVGEAAVIALARELGTPVVLIDERKARKVARDVYGLQTIGTARILIEAKKKGLLPQVGEALATLRREGYWIHEDIVRAALREAGES